MHASRISFCWLSPPLVKLHVARKLLSSVKGSWLMETWREKVVMSSSCYYLVWESQLTCAMMALSHFPPCHRVINSIITPHAEHVR